MFHVLLEVQCGLVMRSNPL